MIVRIKNMTVHFRAVISLLESFSSVFDGLVYSLQGIVREDFFSKLSGYDSGIIINNKSTFI